MTLKYELSRLAGAQYATGEEWRNNSRENEETDPKQKQPPVVEVSLRGQEDVFLGQIQICPESSVK